MLAIFTMNPTSLFLLLVITLHASASPLQDARSAKHYVYDNDDLDDFAKKHHHEISRPKPVHSISSLSQGGHYVNNPNFMVPSGYVDHHEHNVPSHMVDNVHHGPSISNYNERPPIDMFHDRPSLVHSHFSSIIAPMVRGIISNVLINIAHGLSSGIMTGLTSGRPSSSHHDGYSSPHHYRPYLDGHRSSEDFNHPYDTLKAEMEYYPSYILTQPEQNNNRDITLMKPSNRPIIKVVKTMIKENRESPSDSSEQLQDISS